MRPRIGKRVYLPATLVLALVSFAASRRPPIDVAPRPVAPQVPPSSSSEILTAADVQSIVSNAGREAARQGIAAVIAVVDREENILSVFRMDGAPRDLQLVGRRDGFATSDGAHGLPGVIVAGPGVPDATILAAVSKAGTAAVFETTGNAFSTRTASFIIQEHFPPGIDFTPGGPLFGVQFSNLPCTDVKRVDPAGGNLALPLGLSGDPGGLPLYKNGQPVGAIGVEGNGIYAVDFDPAVRDPAAEELAALAGTRGFEAPREIRGDQIFVNGIRLPFADAEVPEPGGAVPAGSFVPGFAPRDGQPSVFVPVVVAGLPATADPRFYPFSGSSAPEGLTADEVSRIIGQALAQAYQTRAAIRRPLGSAAQVNAAVVDARGVVLGIARTPDAPVFGFDVSAQKARTAAFFSSAAAGAALSAAGFDEYVGNAARDGLHLNGAVAFSDRATGFLSRPFFPDGINESAAGPFSRPIAEWSPFNDGLQVDLLRETLLGIVAGARAIAPPCTRIPAIAHGVQIFPGSVPLYKNGVLVGGIGVSGDGVDQDDVIATMGSAGFEAPEEIRSDRVLVRNVRLPWVKFPRHPNL
ncbi:MAG TPA: heme-binding protein [Thermoanaerobaculia bacterium]|nr:heme-binding protein [Thermoanaerobaculia bacterium]